MSYLPTKNDIVKNIIDTVVNKPRPTYTHSIHTTYQPVVENVASVTIEGIRVHPNVLHFAQLVCFDTNGSNVAADFNGGSVKANVQYDSDPPDVVIDGITATTEIKPFDTTPYNPREWLKGVFSTRGQDVVPYDLSFAKFSIRAPAVQIIFKIPSNIQIILFYGRIDCCIERAATYTIKLWNANNILLWSSVNMNGDTSMDGINHIQEFDFIPKGSSVALNTTDALYFIQPPTISAPVNNVKSGDPSIPATPTESVVTITTTTTTTTTKSESSNTTMYIIISIIVIILIALGIYTYKKKKL